MIKDSDIVFITTTLFTECLDLQQSQIKKFFPDSKRILVEATDINRWPNSMFDWIGRIKECEEKYFILIDEDCFIINRDEILRTLTLIDDGHFDFAGCPDGFHPFRTCNPIVINPFLFFGRVEDIKKVDVDFSNLSYKIKSLPGSFSKGQHYEWTNSLKIKFKHTYRDKFIYKHPILSTAMFQDGKEPYYCFFWYLLEMDFKLEYLFPYMDRKIYSTNPKIDEISPEMAIHIWESRKFNSEDKLFGKTTKERFLLAKEHISKL